MASDQIGHEGKRFFPFVFTLFFFILVGNYIGLIPGSFTFTSEIAVTAALAIMVFVVAVIVSLASQGFGFFTHFMPEGAPIAMAPLLVPIEILTFLSRPVSLSIRLFANMVAGHVMFEMFAAFTIMLGGIHLIGPLLGVAPLNRQHGADGARTAGRRVAGLCIRHPHLHLSARGGGALKCRPRRSCRSLIPHTSCPQT